MPGDNGAERQRAFAQAANHFITASLNALGNGNLTLAGEQFHCAHLAQIHAHRVIRAAKIFCVDVPGGGFGFRFLGVVLGLFILGFFGLLGFGVVTFLVLDDLNSHFGQHRHDVLNLLGGHFVLRQHGVQLVKRDVPTLTPLRDQFFDRGRLRIQGGGVTILLS